MNFTLYPTMLSDGSTSEPFNKNHLPFEITDSVRIEAVKDRFPQESFDLWEKMIGSLAINALTRVRFALVHRYDPDASCGGEFKPTATRTTDSWVLVRMIAACLRLIRPMRQQAFLMHGKVRLADGMFDVHGFDDPPREFVEVPEVQKLSTLRNRDADALKTYAPLFLHGMRGQHDKFRFAVRFHELGYFNYSDLEARYLLWCSAIESIYTSNHPHHRGSLVAASRIKWFLGEETKIYSQGELSQFDSGSEITVGAVVRELYKMRSFIAHGDNVPSVYFTETPRQCVAGGVTKAEVLHEAASFIIRASLLKILREGLLAHFANATAAEKYFGAEGLILPILQKARQKSR